ncbi:TPA: hypothetical protein I1702_001533 [Staphylococcus pseudintermedius]|nr:hypothetical protein [Staphylococcus pseudintermedius]
MACLFEWREIIIKYLILAEKPSQASSYAKALGDFKKQKGYFKGQSNILKGEIVITWCIGHLVQLAEMAEYDDKYKNWKKEDLPFIPEKMKYKISKIDSIRSQFNNIKNYVIEQVQEIETSINSKVKQADYSASEIVGECPVCKSNVVKKMSKKKQPFYVCVKEDCEFILFGVVADKTISASDIKALLRKGKTKLIKGFKSRKGTKFDAYLKLEDNKVGFEFAKKK